MNGSKLLILHGSRFNVSNTFIEIVSDRTRVYRSKQDMTWITLNDRELCTRIAIKRRNNERSSNGTWNFHLEPSSRIG